MKRLILMVGLPRSGKSIAAKELQVKKAWQGQSAAIVSTDAIRHVLCGKPFHKPAEIMVWVLARTQVECLFYNHEIVIVDACHFSRRFRDKWKSDYWVREYVVVDTTVDECLRRLSQTGGNQEYHDGMKEAILSMSLEFDPITDDERDDPMIVKTYPRLP